MTNVRALPPSDASTLGFLGSDTSQRFHSESRVFPSTKPINVTNLMNFVVANLPDDLRTTLSETLSASVVFNPGGQDGLGKSASPANPQPQMDSVNLLQSYREEL